MSEGAGAARGAPLLAIDASSGVGSVAVVVDGEVRHARAVPMRPAEAAAKAGAPRADDDPLMRAVADALGTVGLTAREVASVACGAGPGGFTSLRIAAAIAKGLAHAAGCPLLAAPSLGWAAAVRAPAPGTWLVTLDALRGERYVARVELADVDPARIASAWRVKRYDYLGVHPADGVVALVHATSAAGVLDVDADASATPIATGVVALPPSPVDLARWEPAYGRVAEAQARWEATHGPLLPVEPDVSV